MANVQVAVSFVENNRGGRMLVHAGFTFHVKLRRGDRCYWRCSIKTCPATINTLNNVPTKIQDAHNHVLDAEKVGVLHFVRDMQRRCSETLTPIPTLYNESLASLNTVDLDEEGMQMASKIPTFESCRASLYRKRAKVLPVLPKTPGDIQLEGRWKETTSGEQFLLHDNEDERRRMLVFATVSNLEELAASATWYCDGTFYSSPVHFKQLYTVHCLIRGQMFPLVYGLLPDKKETTYTHFFREIQQAAERHHIQLNPSCIMMDFEIAARNAVETIFPVASTKGCFFHFGQAVWRKVQACGQQDVYREDESFQRLVRRAAALPLVPLESLEDVWFAALEDHDDENLDATAFKDYVTENWVENNRQLWNHFQTEGPRTTNHVEGWHNKVNRLLRHPHPNIFIMVNLLKELQSVNEMKMLQYAAGGKPPLKKRKYRDLEERLARLKHRLRDGDIGIMEYTDAASHLIHLGQ